MDGKNIRAAIRAGLVLFVLAAAVPPLRAQESGPLVHRLRWQPVEYASLYEVTVEIRGAANEWIEITRKTTKTETFIDCPLFTGNYRFRVGAYDLLGKPGSTSEWIYFEVRPPQKASPGGKTDTETAGTSAAGTSAGTAEGETPPRPAAEGPTETTGPAYYEGHVPPPEESEKSIFRLGILGAPFITLPFSDFNEIYTSSPIQPVGLALRFSVLPLKTKIGVFGLELLPSWNYMANDILHKSRYAHIFGGNGAILWQIRPFGRSSALNFRLGGGLTYVDSRFVFNDGLDTDKKATWNPSVIAGFSFLHFLNKSMFFDIGLDYYHIFAQDNPTLNYLRPTVGFGWWF
jgi:hypothetical protein